MNGHKTYWIVTGFLLLWGMAYAGLVFFTFVLSTPEHWEALVAEGRITAAYAAYISGIPGWVVAVTAIAALTRLLGAISLALKSYLALPFYTVSLFFVIVIMFRGFVLADVVSVIRTSQVVLEIAFLAISVFAVWYSARHVASGILRR